MNVQSHITSACILVAATCMHCHSDAQQPPRNADWEAFQAYWYAGKAEISTFSLSQARYGEMHSGEAVQIFVTEDFSSTKHIKVEDRERSGSDAVSVLKLNATRQFNTGIYQYNMMQSVFMPVNPVEDLAPLKITASSQDWCGHTWSQMRLIDNRYMVVQHSYFEGEGDRTIELHAVMPEDALWLLIRVGPDNLPTGNFEMIPAFSYQRFAHEHARVFQASGFLEEDDDAYVYRLQYRGIDRSLSITFENAFPFRILGWTETHRSGFGDDAVMLETTAERKGSIVTDYWNHNAPEDSVLRDTLRLRW